MPSNYYDKDQNYQQSQYDKNFKSKHGNIARFVKNSMQNIQEDQIVINLSETQYEVIQIAAEQLGWTVQYSKKSQSWDVKWVDTYIQPQQLFKLNQHQKISHFPGIDIFAKKNLLGKNLMKMIKYFPEDYNFFPMTWSLPSQYGDLKRYNQKLNEQKKKQIFIFKPAASCQGKGIKLTQNYQDLQNKSGIVQIYMNDPLLIENLKFDLRLYVLIYGHDPVRIYLFEQGLARFATQNYVKAGKANIKQNYVHLTNYAINKNNKKFIFNKDQANMDKGHKRSLGFVYNYLAKKGVDVDKLKRKIQNLIVKTVLIGQPMLAHVYHLSQPDNINNDLTFHILGFDVLLKEDYEPVLLQINHTPSFTTDTPLDKKIKKALIKDTLKILNISVQTKKQKISKKMQFLQKRFQRKSTKLTNSEKNLLKQKIEQEKNQFQKNNPCGYKRIYPVQNQEYLKYEQMAKKIFEDQNRMTNKSSPIKNQLNQIDSPTKTPRQSKNTNSKSMKKNKSFHENNNKQTSVNKKTKKFPNSQTLQLKSKLPSLSLSSNGPISTKQRNLISLSAHFPGKMIRNVQFNGEDIFKQIQKKRIMSTQKVYQKKNKNYFIEQITQNVICSLIPSSKFDILFPSSYQQILVNEDNNNMYSNDKNYKQQKSQFNECLQLLRSKKQQADRLKNIIFKKKSTFSTNMNRNQQR